MAHKITDLDATIIHNGVVRHESFDIDEVDEGLISFDALIKEYLEQGASNVVLSIVMEDEDGDV